MKRPILHHLYRIVRRYMRRYTRIKELRRVLASELIPNSKNWRKRSTAQAQALRAMLLDVGYGCELDPGYAATRGSLKICL